MSQKVQAVVVDPSVQGRLTIGAFDAPQVRENEALVRVSAISINRGEVRHAMAAQAGRRPGWDLAGVVEQAAADGTGPKAGSRVVGIVVSGSWAQYVAVPTAQLAAIPDEVSFAQASTLPVAGLTALHSLYHGGFLVAQPVLITGATGGTGDFACQLARLGGAEVVALVRSRERQQAALDSGAHHVITADDLPAAAAHGPYKLIIDSVGGDVFTHTTPLLAPGGTYVIFGTTAGTEPAFNASKFYSTGLTTLYGLYLFKEFAYEPASTGLARLAGLIARKKLHPRISIEENWNKVARVAAALTSRTYTGKAVLHVDEGLK